MPIFKLFAIMLVISAVFGGCSVKSEPPMHYAEQELYYGDGGS